MRINRETTTIQMAIEQGAFPGLKQRLKEHLKYVKDQYERSGWTVEPSGEGYRRLLEDFTNALDNFIEEERQRLPVVWYNLLENAIDRVEWDLLAKHYIRKWL